MRRWMGLSRDEDLLSKEDQDIASSGKEAVPDLETHQGGFSLSVGGLLLAYHVGCLACLKHFGQVDGATPLAGGSAGALAVALEVSGVTTGDQMDIIYRFNDLCRAYGTQGQFASLISYFFDEILDDETVAKFNDRIAPACISYAEFHRFKRTPHLVSRFESQQDIKEVVIGSCMIPGYTRSAATTPVRGARAVDAWFASHGRKKYNRLGAPALCEKGKDVVISPFGLPRVSGPKRASRRGDHGSVHQHYMGRISPDVQEGLERFMGIEEWICWRDYVDNHPVPSRRRGTSDLRRYAATQGLPTRINEHEVLSEAQDDYWVDARCDECGFMEGHIPTPTMDGARYITYRYFSLEDGTVVFMPSLGKTGYRSLLKLGLRPSSDGVQEALFQAGRADAFTWIVAQQRMVEGFRNTL